MSFTINGEGEFGGTQSVTIPSGNTANRPASPAAGELRFNTDTGKVEYWSSTSDTPQWRDIKDGPVNIISTRYLVIGGGGGGGGYIQAGGGGAGGYRTNFGSGNISGGLSSVEADLNLVPDTEYTVTVGAGGAGGINNATTGYGGRGVDSVFHTITSYGGGGGGIYSGIMPPTSQLPVGSGGGFPNHSVAGGNGQEGTAGQGFSGGDKTFGAHCSPYSGCGGGGAGAEGGDRIQCADVPAGGDGLASSITGTSVTRAGGGGGGPYDGGYTGGAGGAGGGGAGGNGGASGTGGTAGTANTGGGGGGSGTSGGSTGGDGGSGVVIIRIPNTYTATFTGVTASAAATVGSDRVYTVTAGNGTVTFTKD